MSPPSCWSAATACAGTVRNKAKGPGRVLDAMAHAGVEVAGIELVEADLGADRAWREAVADCRYVQHVASPFPMEAPDDREALVPEARAGGAARAGKRLLGRRGTYRHDLVPARRDDAAGTRAGEDLHRIRLVRPGLETADRLSGVQDAG